MTRAPETLAPPAASGGLSAANISDAWYVACESHELGKKPLARTVLGTPLALFRDASGAPGALLDRARRAS